MGGLRQVHLLVSGKVQGVGFRYATLNKALSLDLRGWVRNTHDDKVEVCAEGISEKMDEFVEWLNSGPPMARVLGVQIIKSQKMDKYSLDGFKIRH